MTDDVIKEPFSSQAMTKQQRTITLVGALLSMFMSSLNQTVIGTAMPRIIIELGGFAHYTWVATGFMITSTVIVPIAGKLSDLFGRKRLYLIGQGVFILGALLSGFSQTLTQLIFFRALQGIGAGTMMANTVAITADLFPPAERGKYSGMMTGVMGLSSVIGPTLGGFITDTLSWHWVFWVNIPLGITVITLVFLYFPDLKKDDQKPRVEDWGVFTFSLALVPAMLALSWGGVEWSWFSFPILGLLGFALFMGLLFFLIEKKIEEPLIPFSLYQNPIFRISQLIVFLMGMGMFGSMIFIPLFFQGVLGATATISGSFMTPMMLGLMVGSFTSGQFLSRAGGHYRWQGLIGLGAMALGLYFISRMSPQTGFSQAVINIILTGVGVGIIMPCYTIAVQNSVPLRLMGTASSLMVFARSIGGTLGLTLFGSVMNDRFHFYFLEKLSPALQAMIGPDQLGALAKNPQALVSPKAQMRLRAFFGAYGSQGAAWSEQILNTMRQALALAISQVFLIAMALILVGFIANLFLKEIPLRKHHDLENGAGQGRSRGGTS
ncbi:MAG: MDR family MFS transporter [Thermodesulfobacteriota bacterium]